MHVQILHVQATDYLNRQSSGKPCIDTSFSDFFARYLSATKEVGTKSHRARLEIRVDAQDLVRPAIDRLNDNNLLRHFLRHGCLTVSRSHDLGTFALAQVLTARCFLAPSGQAMPSAACH